MKFIPDAPLCDYIGIKKDQRRRIALHRNVWWSFDHGKTAFGYGDLDQEDLRKIWDYLDEPENREKVFTGWHEHHGTKFQTTDKAQVRISWASGATKPYDSHLEMKTR